MIRARTGSPPAFMILALGLGLAGCNANSAPLGEAPPPASPAVAAAAAPQQAPMVDLPPGAACTAAIQRWRAVIDHDYQAGYSYPAVYESIQKDIAQEQSVCAAGHDSEAVKMVQKSRRKHGYPLN